jgi:poly(A) polymerase
MSSSALERIRSAVPLSGAWLVGGSVRDLLLERPVVDIDLLVQGDPAAAAREVARLSGGAPFPLSERHGAWRVMRDGETIDVARSRGTVLEDLALRDFTINAMALPLDGGELVDPHGGTADLDGRIVRKVSDRIFDDDPLRLLRLARIAHELGFAIDEATEALARSRAALASSPSGERIFMELRRLLSPADPGDGVRLLERLGALEPVWPELAAVKGVTQGQYHALDVFDHTIHVLDAVADVAAHAAHYLPQNGGAVEARMGETVGDDVPVWLALRFAALLHDIAKPETRREFPGGRVGFPGHDAQGAQTAIDIMGRWHTSAALARFTATMVRSHLMLGFDTRSRPFDRRTAHRYLQATAPWHVASIVLSLADRVATRGWRSKARHLRVHAEAATELLGLLFEMEADDPTPLLRGDEIAREAGVCGADIGLLVERLAEEQAAGAITTREEAIRFVRSAEI